MINKTILSISLLLFTVSLMAQIKNLKTDSTQNNFNLPANYQTSEAGAIPYYSKSGKGKKVLIMIAGYGFDETIFDDFVKDNRKKYTIYTITIPGFGNTKAAPTPPDGTSFSKATWSKGMLEGLRKLIEKEKLGKPVIVGHFTLGAQLAVRMAIDYPDLVGGVIIIGGPAKFIPVQNGKAMMNVPIEMRIMGVDKFSAGFFKVVSKETWDSNSYLSSMYSLNETIAKKCWDQQAAVPLQVMVRYICEFQAADISLEVSKVKCPMLVLRPGFTTEMISHPEDGTTNYIKPQFIDSWDEVKKLNPSVQIRDIANSGAFIWKDQPKQCSEAIFSFVLGLD